MPDGMAWLNFVSFNNCQECATIIQHITQKAILLRVEENGPITPCHGEH